MNKCRSTKCLLQELGHNTQRPYEVGVIILFLQMRKEAQRLRGWPRTHSGKVAGPSESRARFSPRAAAARLLQHPAQNGPDALRDASRGSHLASGVLPGDPEQNSARLPPLPRSLLSTSLWYPLSSPPSKARARVT